VSSAAMRLNLLRACSRFRPPANCFSNSALSPAPRSACTLACSLATSGRPHAAEIPAPKKVHTCLERAASFALTPIANFEGLCCIAILSPLRVAEVYKIRSSAAAGLLSVVDTKLAVIKTQHCLNLGLRVKYSATLRQHTLIRVRCVLTVCCLGDISAFTGMVLLHVDRVPCGHPRRWSRRS
jgi:hypothetical protein